MSRVNGQHAMRRRTFCATLFAVAKFGADTCRAAASGPVLVIAPSGTEAYSEAVEGIRTGLANAMALELVGLGNGNPDDLARTLPARRPSLVIGVGAEAMSVLIRHSSGIPAMATMILASDIERAEIEKARHAGVIGAVSLDLPVAAVCRECKRLLPDRIRLGVIRNPRNEGPPSTAVEAQAASAGYATRIVECSRPGDLLPALLELRSSADIVWCVPDSTLYNSATVKPLLMASLMHRLPIIGFSESFVRAGALMGVYPDYRDVGRQTAELARRWAAGESFARWQPPRTVRAAFNHRVARLIGLRYTPPAQGSEVLLLK